MIESIKNNFFLQELIAVERVYAYSRLNTEVNADGSDRAIPFGWPCQGVVKYENVSLKYRYVSLSFSLFRS